MKSAIYIHAIFLICFVSIAHSQELRDSSILDSLFLDSNITPNDSLERKNNKILISDSSFEDVIEYDARDTNWTNISKSEVHLIGNAFVKYQDFEIHAGYIIFNFNKQEAYAEGIIDQEGVETQQPKVFVGGKELKYNKLRYNFKTKKGIVYNARSTEGELIIHGAITKFVGKESDTIPGDEFIYNKNALITTCDLEHPHYGIRTSKLKFIPDKLAVLGPAVIEIAGVPTPIVLPFAFFPLIEGQSSGLVFGKNDGFFEFSDKLGFGLKNIGYYWYLNDYMDLEITGDLYSRGTWRTHANMKYAKRYKYRGSISLGYSSIANEIEGVIGNQRTNSFQFRVAHSQDSKAHPYRRISGSFGFSTNNYYKNVKNDYNSQTQSTYSSNMSYSNAMPRFDALSFTASLQHSQNTKNGDISFTLPNMTLSMNQIYPFKREKGGNKDKWYEKIGVRYGAKLKNKVTTTDSLLFTRQTLDDFQLGISQNISSSLSFNVMKYYVLSTHVNYTENWNFKTTEKYFDPTLFYDTTFVEETFLIEEIDTSFGEVVTETDWKFKPYRNLDVGLNLNTTLFKTLQFNAGRLKGLRHVMAPSIGFSYRPSTTGYYEEVRDDYFDPTSTDMYSPFSQSPFPVNSFSGKQMNLTYSLNNNVEAKFYSKKDDKDKKIKLINNLRFNGSYNFAADSLRWSRVSYGGSTPFFKNIGRISYRGTFDPYLENNNRRINKTTWSERKLPVRFEDFSVGFSMGLRVKQFRSFFSSESKDEKRNEPEERAYMDDPFWDLFNNFSFNYQFRWKMSQADKINTSKISTSSLTIRGSFELTETWSVNLGNIAYDFLGKSFVYPSLGLEKDLHCWHMNFQWYPSGGTYNFFIGVKSSQIGSVLKYNYGSRQGRGFY